MANTSFLPEDYIEKKIQQRTNAICLVLFCIVLGGVIAAWWVTNRQRIDDERQDAQVNKQFIEADRRLQEFNEMQTRRADLMLKAQVTSALLERVPRTLILSELINNMPASMGLLELTLSTRASAAKAHPTNLMDKAKQERNQGLVGNPDDIRPPTEVSLDVAGMAPTDVQVAQFMTALGKSPVFADLTLVYTEDMVIETEHMRKFGITMMINQDVDIKNIEPRMVKRDTFDRNPMSTTLQIDQNGQISNVSPTAPKVVVMPAQSN